MSDEWTYLSLDEWQAQGTVLFGPDVDKWRFVCPSCGQVQTRQDWLDLGMNPRQVDQRLAFTCIGRWSRSPDTVPAFEPSAGAGCMYVGDRGPNISPTVVVISTDPLEHRPTFGYERKRN